MAKITLPNNITESELVEFDMYTVKDEDAVTTLKPLGELEASEGILNCVIRNIMWKPYAVNGLIGYDTSTNIDGLGMTESEAYNIFISEWKEKERKFKRQFILPTLSQTQYDALLSLYYFTGDYKYVGSNVRKIQISEYIKNREWKYIATAMLKSGYQRSQRRQESSIMMLGDYGSVLSRADIKARGIQMIRSNYPDLLDVKQQRQAEYVYYAETTRFLPKMTQSRMRQIVKLLES